MFTINGVIGEYEQRIEPMTPASEHPVHFTTLDDGTALAASVSGPLFAVSTGSVDEAKAKAQRALDFWCAHSGGRRPARPSRTLTPFAPERIEHLQPSLVACV